VFLFRRELIQPVAHRVELEARDLLVQVLRNNINLRLEVLVIRAQILGGKRLVGEAQSITEADVFGGGKIDEAASARR